MFTMTWSWLYCQSVYKPWIQRLLSEEFRLATAARDASIETLHHLALVAGRQIALGDLRLKASPLAELTQLESVQTAQQLEAAVCGAKRDATLDETAVKVKIERACVGARRCLGCGKSLYGSLHLSLNPQIRAIACQHTKRLQRSGTGWGGCRCLPK